MNHTVVCFIKKCNKTSLTSRVQPLGGAETNANACCYFKSIDYEINFQECDSCE